MEKVLYNCILGAKSIRKDGFAFYYSDYNNDASKVYHPQPWHCCTGTFSQITPDYHISAYFHSERALYVNLFVPSRVTFAQPDARIELTQTTSYPHTPSTSLALTLDRPASFALNLRIPAWAGPKTTISVNGKPQPAPAPGHFASIQRIWKNGDRVEIEFDMPTLLEPVDPQHPNQVAVVHGPLALFAIGAVPEQISREQLMKIRQTATGSTNWELETGAAKLSFLPFASIEDQHYRLYLNAAAG